MKKNLNVLITLMLVLCTVLAGCGSDAEDVGGTVVSNESIAATVPGGTVAQETTAPAAETTAPAEETTAPVEEKIASLGRMEGGTYINEYVGFGCDLDANWTFYSAEELQELPSNVAELMAGTELGDAASQMQQITDMMAENVNDLTTMNVLYQKLSMQERIAYAALDEEAILDATLAQSDMLIEAYTQAGIEVESIEKVTVTFLGEERLALKTVAQTQGVGYYILQLFDFHLGQYSVTTTFSSYVEDKTESMLELFYKVGE